MASMKGVQLHRLAVAQGGLDAAERQALAGFPAVEGVAVVGQQHQQVGIGQAVVQHHRGREVAQQRAPPRRRCR
jgi:hypothetical protein